MRRRDESRSGPLLTWAAFLAVAWIFNGGPFEGPTVWAQVVKDTGKDGDDGADGDINDNDGQPGGPGGAASATAAANGVAENTSEAIGGKGGKGGDGTTDINNKGGNGGDSGRGGDAKAVSTRTAAGGTAKATATGGASKNAGNGAGGIAQKGGDGGLGMAGGNAEAFATNNTGAAIATATGGNGGNGGSGGDGTPKGVGKAGGAGGVAIANATNADGPQAQVDARATGGNGGRGGNGANLLAPSQSGRGGDGGLANAIAAFDKPGAPKFGTAIAIGGNGGDAGGVGPGAKADQAGDGGGAFASVTNASLVDVSATGGRGGSADRLSRINPGKGGDATAEATAQVAGNGNDATAIVRATGGNGGTSAQLPGRANGGNATATAIVLSEKGTATADVSATTGLTPKDSTAKATAMATANGVAGEIKTESFAQGLDQVRMASGRASAMVKSTDSAGSVATLNGLAPDTAAATLLQSAAFVSGAPLAPAVVAFSASAPAVTAGLTKNPELVFGLATLVGRAAADSTGALTTQFSVAEFLIDPSAIPGDANLLVGLINPLLAGSDFDSLTFQVRVNNSVVRARSFTPLDYDSRFFTDNLLNLGPISSFGGSLLDVELALAVSVHEPRNGFGLNAAVGVSAVPEPSTHALCALLAMTAGAHAGSRVLIRGRGARRAVAARRS